MIKLTYVSKLGGFPIVTSLFPSPLPLVVQILNFEKMYNCIVHKAELETPNGTITYNLKVKQ